MNESYEPRKKGALQTGNGRQLSRVLDSIPHRSIDEVEWSVRAKNALSHLRVQSLRQLADMDGTAISAGRSVGAKTVRELIRGCLAMYYFPNFVRQVRPLFGERSVEEVDLTRFAFIAGPYDYTERWMLELAIAQLGHIDWCVRRLPGEQYELYRGTHGFVFMAEEED